MRRKIIKTADGATTIYLEDWKESYHSKHGAIQESYHVFIKNGLSLFTGFKKQITILEMGFGTGLNTFITFLEAEKQQLSVHYETVEAYPVLPQEISQLNYTEMLHSQNGTAGFNHIHQLSWEEKHHISAHFTLKKRRQFFSEVSDQARFNLIYFDAFGARVQPHLWEEAMFSRMFKALTSQGKLVTYAARGSVRRAMQKVGFSVERLPGPPGKREMLRATRP